MSAAPTPPIPNEDIERLSRNPQFRERMAALYADLEAQIAAHAPVCWNRGHCCNFGRSGHRLYVTPLELAYFVLSHGRDGGTKGRMDEETNVTTSKSQNVKTEDNPGIRTATVRERPESVGRVSPADPNGHDHDSHAADACPYQIDGLCTVRDVRPLGCRVYFCQASSRWWQGPMTESWLARLKALHAEFGVPYAYVEWLAALRAVDET